MIYLKKSIFFLTLFAISSILYGQAGLVSFNLKLLAGYNGPDNVPFWMRSNQFGSIPPVGPSIGLIGTVKKDYNPARPRKTDWGFSAEGRFNVGNPVNFILVEGYGKFRLGIFQLKAGRTKEISGLCDTVLSSGSFSISGNAPGIPKIEISIPEYYTLPFFGRLFAFKGSYIHGWIGNWYFNDESVEGTPTYLHQKFLYGRFGKPEWKLKLYGGFNHQVVWGNEKEIMGEDFILNGFETFLYVNTGKAYNHDTIQSTRIGNHLGSIDLGLGYDFTNTRLLIYRQTFYDAGALYYLANLLDGLNGISLVNKNNRDKGFHWNRLLVEFLYTKNQAGETWSRNTTSPFENYYNNGYYKPGWSYKGVNLGTPFISPYYAIKEELPKPPDNYFTNNKVAAIHLGLDAKWLGWNILTKVSYSRNYGTWESSATGKDYEGSVYPSPYGVFPETGEFSAYLETNKELIRGINIGFITAFDAGDLYDNSFGFMCSVSKSF